MSVPVPQRGASSSYWDTRIFPVCKVLVQPEFGHVVAGYACTLVLRGLSARLGTFLRHYKDETKPAVTWLSV